MRPWMLRQIRATNVHDTYSRIERWMQGRIAPQTSTSISLATAFSSEYVKGLLLLEKARSWSEAGR